MYTVLWRGKTFHTYYILILLTATVSWKSHACSLIPHHRTEGLSAAENRCFATFKARLSWVHGSVTITECQKRQLLLTSSAYKAKNAQWRKRPSLASVQFFKEYLSQAQWNITNIPASRAQGAEAEDGQCEASFSYRAKTHLEGKNKELWWGRIFFNHHNCYF